MKNNIKFFIALFVLTGLIIACGNSDKSDSNTNKVKESPKTTYEKGIDELQKGNYTQSLEILSTIKKKDKDYNSAQSKINYIKGIQLFNIGKHDDAIEYFEAVDKNDIYYSEAQKYLGKIEFEANKYTIALSLLKNDQLDSALAVFMKIPSSDENYKKSLSKINYINGKKYYAKESFDTTIIYLSQVNAEDEYYSESKNILDKINTDRETKKMRLYAIIGSFIFIVLIIIVIKIIRSKKRGNFTKEFNQLFSDKSLDKISHVDIEEIAKKAKLNINSGIVIKYLKDYYKKNLSKCITLGNINNEYIKEIELLTKIFDLKTDDRQNVNNEVGSQYYTNLLTSFLKDSKITSEETKILLDAKTFFNLSPDIVTSITNNVTGEIYKDSLEKVLQDGEITKEEKAFLESLRLDLHLSKEKTDELFTKSSEEKFKHLVNDLISNKNIYSNDIDVIYNTAKNFGINLQDYKYELTTVYENALEQVINKSYQNENIELLKHITFKFNLPLDKIRKTTKFEMERFGLSDKLKTDDDMVKFTYISDAFNIKMEDYDPKILFWMNDSNTDWNLKQGKLRDIDVSSSINLIKGEICHYHGFASYSEMRSENVGLRDKGFDELFITNYRIFIKTGYSINYKDIATVNFYKDAIEIHKHNTRKACYFMFDESNGDRIIKVFNLAYNNVVR